MCFLEAFAEMINTCLYILKIPKNHNPISSDSNTNTDFFFIYLFENIPRCHHRMVLSDIKFVSII